jgi:hypothetical protein
MDNTMKAAVARELGNPLAIEEAGKIDGRIVVKMQ